ncbi:MAG: hypothetical protein RR301_02315 [Clostridia bacterium]
MDNKALREFTVKFAALNANNQKYIVAIQQALMYAQTSSGKVEKTKKKGQDRVPPDD